MWFAAFSLCATPFLAAAPSSEGPALPPGGRVLVDPAGFRADGDEEDFGLQREGFGVWRGEPVWRARSFESALEAWRGQIQAEITRPVRQGHRGVFVVQARAIETSHESDQAQLRLVVFDKTKPWPRIAVSHFFADRQWRDFALPFTFAKDIPAGDLVAVIELGFGRQLLELAGPRVFAYDAAVPLEALPRTRPTYLGHAADASWRREALARIEQIRKGELTITLVDARGRAVKGAEVRAVLRSHAFHFGTAVNVDTFTLPSPDREKYREHVAALFNAGTLENGLKWENWLGEKKPADYRARTFETLDWLRERGFAMRGHVMVWPGRRFLPEKILAMLAGPERARVPEVVRAHIHDIGRATKEHVFEWDVLNEPVTHRDLMDAFGREIMVEWFKEAAKATPDTPLFLNDWGNHDQRQSPDHVDDFEEIARYLLDNGAPLGGLGLQCHVGGVLSPPEDILGTLDRYARTLKLPVRVTELDVALDDPEIQADYTRDFFIALFSHPSVVGVQQWGFWEGRHWLPKAALYTKDWKERPNGAAYRKLVKETWHTDERGRTDESGAWSVRGFHGSYTVTVKHAGREHSFAVDLRPDGGDAPRRLTMPAAR